MAENTCPHCGARLYGVLASRCSKCKKPVNLKKFRRGIQVEWLIANRSPEQLITALKDTDRSVRDSAAEALGRIGGARVAKQLIGSVKNSKRNASRKRVVEVLGLIGTPAVKPIIPALKDDSPAVRLVAVEALGRIGDSRAVELLIAALDGHDLSDAAIEALGRIGAPAVEPLTAALESKKVWGWQTEGQIAVLLVKHGMSIGDPRLQTAIQRLGEWVSKPDEKSAGVDEDWKRVDSTTSHKEQRDVATGILERIVAGWISRGNVDRLSELDFQTSEELLIQSLEQNLDWQTKGHIAVLLVKHGVSIDDPRLQGAIQQLRVWASKPDGSRPGADSYVRHTISHKPQREAARAILNRLT